MVKKLYWLKMHKDFFKSKDIKKLRKISGGDTFTIIYLKMMLLSIDNGGSILYEGIEPTFAEELALELDEDSVNVNATILFLQNMQLITEDENDLHTLNHVEQIIGSETPQAGYMRKKRVGENQSLTEENVTMLKPVTKVLHQSKRIELDIELENRDISIYTLIFDFWIKNTSNLAKPRKLTDKIESAINGLVKDGYNQEAIQGSIQKYNHIVNGKQYFFNYKWNLLEFLKRSNGCRHFADVEDDKQYLNNDKGSQLADETPF